MTILHAVITAGGTSEPIDAVRVISNLSSGRLGARLAESFARSGVRVTLLTSGHRPEPHPGIEVVPYRDSEQLRTELDALLEQSPDIVCMAAAVSDYTVIPSAGKLSSDADSITLTLTRAPKILPTLRPRCPNALIVGFKLLSDVSPAHLLEVARAQSERCGLDATVANDRAHFTEGRHPAQLVWSLGGVESLDGTKAEVAEVLAAALLAKRDPRAERRRAPLVRPATPVELNAESWADVYRRLPPALVTPARPESPVTPVPLWIPAAVPLPVGCLTRRGNIADLWIDPPKRGKGLATAFLAHMDRSNLALRCHPQTRDFFARRGWVDPDNPSDPQVVRAPGYLCESRPPTLAISEAASLALWHRPTNQVLVGKRLAGAAQGAWAFPGGHIEAGETPMDAAIAELWEEAGIRLPPPVEARWFTSYVASQDRIFRIRTATIEVGELHDARRSEELEPRWITVNEAVRHPKILPGPRWILQQWLGTSDAGRQTTE